MKYFIENIKYLYDEAIFEEKYCLVSSLRKEKIDSFRFQKDKCLSLGAELVLMKALDELKIPKDDRDIENGKSGKPYLLEHEDIFFNLSHSGEMVMCAIGDNSIGCDIEKIDNCNLKIAERKFAKEEFEYIKNAETYGEKSTRFYRIWTHKESLLKATGEGITTSLDSFSVVKDEQIAMELEYKDEKYKFSEINISGYSCCICERQY